MNVGLETNLFIHVSSEHSPQWVGEHDRLTCTAQPGHGGKRSDSPEGRVPSAITEILQVIDHEPTNLNETQ